MRILAILTIILLILPFSFALEECKRVQERDGIPCRVTTTWQPENPCNTYTSQIFNDHGILIENLTLGTFGNSGFCQFNFTHTTLGSYPYNITNGDTGNINVVPAQETKMLSVILTFMFSIAVMIFIGIIGRTMVTKYLPFAIAVIEFLMLVFVIYAMQTNGDITNLLRINFFSLLIAVGFFGLINLYGWVRDMMVPDQETEEEKWAKKSKWG